MASVKHVDAALNTVPEGESPAHALCALAGIAGTGQAVVLESSGGGYWAVRDGEAMRFGTELEAGKMAQGWIRQWRASHMSTSPGAWRGIRVVVCAERDYARQYHVFARAELCAPIGVHLSQRRRAQEILDREIKQISDDPCGDDVCGPLLRNTLRDVAQDASRLLPGATVEIDI